ncbi:hypothetical protein GH714_030797 [Hevea brasiliensis]|uniref:Lysosomal Pro-X carboxypeptidase n=1 Tax=Hevea brasiliensis TaxID=3981 RepID=A0A6A6M4X8_HEVBR|nr:hypothetical protein GH714_030797 [Hevea brasiliensis]
MMGTGFISIWFLPLFSLLVFGISSAHFIPIRFTPIAQFQAEKDSVSSPTGLYKEKFFTQILDHFNFNPQSYQTFQQRYLINDTFWGGPKKNAPIFLYTGNEGEIEWFAQNTGFMYDNAPRFKALIVFIEHRYYGKSIPFGGNEDVAKSNASTLGYLSSTQALADYATLITHLKNNLSATDSPVVVFGVVDDFEMGSLRNQRYFLGFAVLAAWFRLKYPHVAIGALASSAPILGFVNLTSPYSFSKIITQDFRVLSLSLSIHDIIAICILYYNPKSSTPPNTFSFD